MTLHKPLFIGATGLTYDQSDFRRIQTALSTPGVRAANEYLVNATGSMNVNVNAGRALVAGNFVSVQNFYECLSDSTYTVTIGTAPTSGQQRIDLVGLAVFDDEVGTEAGGSNEFRIVVKQGTAAATGSAVVPTPTLKNWLSLAEITVNGGATQITAANIKDVRVLMEPPSLAGRYARKDIAQTFAGVQTFSSRIVAPGMQLGTGASHGVNFVDCHSASQPLAMANNTHVNVPWTINTEKSDDASGSMYDGAAKTFAAPVSGLYTGTVCWYGTGYNESATTTLNATGSRIIQWRVVGPDTILGGTACDAVSSEFAPIGCSFQRYLPAGTKMYVNFIQTSGRTLFYNSGTPEQPFHVSFALVA